MDNTTPQHSDLVMIPLICKDISDARYMRVIRLLALLLILTNLAWSSTWLIATHCTKEEVIENNCGESNNEVNVTYNRRTFERRYICTVDERLPETS